MSFTDQKPRVATTEDVRAQWGGGKKGKYFRCYLCGHKFAVGDQYRFVFGNRSANCLVCQSCDGSNQEVQEKWNQLHNEFTELSNGKFWYFTSRQIDSYEDELSEIARNERELEEDAEYWKREASYGRH